MGPARTPRAARGPARAAAVLLLVAAAGYCLYSVVLMAAQCKQAAPLPVSDSAPEAGNPGRLQDASRPQEGSSSPAPAAAAPAAASQAPARSTLAVPPALRSWGPARVGKVPAEAKARCQGTTGRWCASFFAQEPIPAEAPPAGDRTCVMDCNFVGVCNALTGICQCPAGWTGLGCSEVRNRPCTHTYHSHGWLTDGPKANISVGITAESFWGFPQSHCAGTCDDRIAACFCPNGTAYGREPAAPGAVPGAPPARRGRPMHMYCQPNKDEQGRASNWGTVDPAELYSPDHGWCSAPEPKLKCECYQDGWGGPLCDVPYEQFCLNQCNGHGDCDGGFCRCHEGWWGHDCANRRAGVPLTPGLEEQRPWLKRHIHTPAAAEPAPGATRRRPLIYVYELPPLYNTVLQQYRLTGDGCVHRRFTLLNETELGGWVYQLESGLHEMMLQSEHRTLDPEEADFFYVPVYTSCFINPVRDVADFPWWYSHYHNRAQGSTNMQLEAWHWLRAHHPYWDRNGGRDHIWLVTHDEASCYVPAAIRPSIIMSHWGRVDLNHTSGTGYGADHYGGNTEPPKWDFSHPLYEPKGYHRKIAGHACFDPKKDLVLPTLKTPREYNRSPLMGVAPRARELLAVFQGRLQFELPEYSRGIRQALARAAWDGDWWGKHSILIGDHANFSALLPGGFAAHMPSATFCLSVMGDGWTTRFEDAVLNGCIPVVISDDVQPPWFPLLRLEDFSLRVLERDVGRLADILLSVPKDRIAAMQAALAKVWRRYAWSSFRPFAAQVEAAVGAAAEPGGAAGPGGGAGGGPLPAAERGYNPREDDAFQTLMQWLFSRIDATHGQQGAPG